MGVHGAPYDLMTLVKRSGLDSHLLNNNNFYDSRRFPLDREQFRRERKTACSAGSGMVLSGDAAKGLLNRVSVTVGHFLLFKAVFDTAWFQRCTYFIMCNPSE